MRSFGLSELIQSGILVTLLTCAFGLGKMLQKIDSKLEFHDSRIAKLEGIMGGGKWTSEKN